MTMIAIKKMSIVFFLSVNGHEADPLSAGLAEWLGISLGLEKGERLFLKFVTEK
jgi:hypothetical protein